MVSPRLAVPVMRHAREVVGGAKPRGGASSAAPYGDRRQLMDGGCELRLERSGEGALDRGAFGERDKRQHVGAVDALDVNGPVAARRFGGLW
jgi:hypothetical protein